ncbi:Histidine-containing phosphotransfer protein 4 [Auxenochlorella protothecoides]|uniref:Histidine-containing phosphotransfer protein n=1 Tax=Auxenochlorella protothecoides TaxID=3075 RepID=A0A087SR77_AUXPR|nr:Histidine-containing phosphotransfer protein 4 [Auxenochlorella protothecoides]KFM28231.1 Histidine-containing phosphotransfer protein 4 [Auxenochlorella protothecoides]
MTEGLEEFLTRAITAGILNDQFRELLSLQDPSDPGFVRGIIDLFLNDSRKKLMSLQEAVMSHDGEAAAALAHQMKGSSASLGAPALAARFSALDRLARDGHTNDMGLCLAEVYDSFHVLQQCLREYLALGV